MNGRRLLSLLVLAAASCSPEPPAAIGVILPLEGALKEGGHELQAGIDLALGTLPAEARPRVLVADNAGLDRQTTVVLDQLVSQGARLILGPLTTDNVRTASIAAREHGVFCVAPAATGVDVAAPDVGWLRFCFGDDEAGAALARFARGTLRLQRLALVIDLESGYALGLSQAFGREFQRLEGLIVAKVYYHAGGDDTAGALQRAAEHDVEGVLVAGYAPDIVRMLQATSDETLAELILLGGDAWEGTGLRPAVAGRVRGAYRTRHFDPGSADPLVVEFVERFRATHGEEPGDLAALGFDAARAVLSVFDAHLGSAELLERLLALRAFPGVTGELTVGRDGAAMGKPILLEQLHDPSQPAVLGRIDG